MAASEFGYYNQKHSPPVSPRSQPLELKRRAQDDESETGSGITNHFKKLRLHNAKLPSASQIAPVGIAFRNVPSPSASPILSAVPNDLQSLYHAADAPTHNTDDLMPVDETAHRIYIHDLDSEIAEIEADEARDKTQFFIPDVDKKVGKIPHRLLQRKNNSEDATSNMQMVLYREPTSISVPEEEDAVRLAVIAARARVRERQKEEMRHEDIGRRNEADNFSTDGNFGAGSDLEHFDDEDPDSMDLG